MAKLKILGIPGSLRQNSYNKGLLRAAQQLVPADVELEIFDLNGIPLFNEDDEKNPPERVVEFRRKIREADAILFATPEYNYSMPGVLKNAIDWGSRPYGQSSWHGKPTGIMGASPGVLGTARSQYHLRQIFVALDVKDMKQPELMIANAGQKFDSQGNLTDETTRQHLQKFLPAFIAHVKKCQAIDAATTVTA